MDLEKKIAVLLSGIDEGTVRRLLQGLRAGVAERILKARSRLGPGDDAAFARVYLEFLQQFRDVGGGLDSLGKADALMQAILDNGLKRGAGSRAAGKASASERLAGAAPGGQALSGISSDPGWLALSQCGTEELYRAVKDENLAVKAVLIAMIEASSASRLLVKFAVPERVELLLKVAGMGRLDPESLEAMRDVLLGNLEKVRQAGGGREVGGIKNVAKLLAQLGPDASAALLSGLQERDQGLAQAVATEMFGLDDMIRIEDRDLIRFLGGVGDQILQLALRRVDEALKARLLGLLSRNRRQRIEDEWERKARLSDVDLAQREFLELLQKAVAAGNVKLLDPNDRLVG